MAAGKFASRLETGGGHAPGHLGAVALGATDFFGLRPDQFLELVLAMITSIFVNGHDDGLLVPRPGQPGREPNRIGSAGPEGRSGWFFPRR